MIRQLSVFVENKPGSFRNVNEVLCQAGIRVQAFCSVDSPEFGILRVIADRPEDAERLLREAGFMVKSYDVIAVQTEGADSIFQLFAACSESNLSINYTYSAFCDADGVPVTVFHCEYLEETESLLRTRGFVCLDSLCQRA